LGHTEFASSQISGLSRFRSLAAETAGRIIVSRV
jgi:hypothetical protein